MDDALNESMLNPNIQKDEVKKFNKETEIDMKEPEENIESKKNNDENDRTIRDELGSDVNESDKKEGIPQDLRRSNRIRKQQININPDEIGECDDEKDEDYN